MNAQDIIKRVQAKLDDPEGSYLDEEYVLTHLQGAYEDLQNELRLSGYQFEESVVVIPSVPAGTRDLSAYMADDQPLAGLLQPRIIEWKQPGLDDTNWRGASGPLDAVRDVANGIPQLDSWAWIKGNIYLSNTGIDLDLRIRGDFFFAPLTGPDNPVQFLVNAKQALVYLTAESIADARGNDKWSLKYGRKAGDAIDNLGIAMVKAEQSKTRRVARMSRRSLYATTVNMNR